jgi:selenide,water dikinase
MVKLDKVVYNFKLIEGYSAETSGGLLICLSEENAKAFIKEFSEFGLQAYEVGEVIEGTNIALIAENPEIIDVWDQSLYY